MENSSHYKKTDPVALVPLPAYTRAEARECLEAALSEIGALDKITAGMHIIIKANLVSAMKPERAATTHPVLIAALCDIITARGAHVTIGDSPGGLYTQAFVERVYRAAGMNELVTDGVALNSDFSERTASFPEARVLKSFTYTAYLDGGDMIINFAKLKSHGMMGMSCAAKNLFGTIPGLIKPEYHYRFPRHEDFADMLLDLDEYFHPEISIVDAVVAMEGNGPTAGTPKPLGCILASHSPHTLDMVAAKLIGYESAEIPTVAAALRRGLVPESFAELDVRGDVEALASRDFQHVVERTSLKFTGNGKSPLRRLFGAVAALVLKTRPKLSRGACVGCGVCADICPAKAIVIARGKAKIDRKKCIRCFCCQEFCPKSAMRVKRGLIASLFHRREKN